MATYLPALRARMGTTDYFLSVVTLGEASRLIEYVEEVDSWTVETPPELKLQRKLNIQRVERELVPYLLSRDDHFYSSLTVEIRPVPYEQGPGEVEFTPKENFPGGVAFGSLTLDGTEVLAALDGQHRLKSIERAIRQKPELAREHIALIMVPFRGLERSQSLFSDLNRYARAPSKSIALLFTHREVLARVAKALTIRVPLLRDRTNMESTSLSINSRYFITLSTLYETTRALAGKDTPDDPVVEDRLIDELAGIWIALTDAIAEWGQVARGEEHPAYLRQRFLHMHGVGQQAIALVVAAARQASGENWRRILEPLGVVDWRVVNPAWQGVALHGGRVTNTSTSIQLLARALRKLVGLDAEPLAAPFSDPAESRQ